MYVSVRAGTLAMQRVSAYGGGTTYLHSVPFHPPPTILTIFASHKPSLDRAAAVMLPKREPNDSLRTPTKKKKKEKGQGNTLKTALKEKDKRDKGKEEKPEKPTKREASGGG